MSYQNTSISDGKARFVSVTTKGEITEAYFTSKVTGVSVAGNRKIPVVTDTVTVARQKDVSCADSECVEAYIGNNVKVSFTAQKSDSAAITSLIDETIRLLGLWRSMHADHGIVPPASATFGV